MNGAELLGDTVISSAILDRLPRHSYVLNIRGESYHLREKRQAGLFPSQHLNHPPQEDGNNRQVAQFQLSGNNSLPAQH